jgi:hypothetical protein
VTPTLPTARWREHLAARTASARPKRRQTGKTTTALPPPGAFHCGIGAGVYVPAGARRVGHANAATAMEAMPRYSPTRHSSWKTIDGAELMDRIG